MRASPRRWDLYTANPGASDSATQILEQEHGLLAKALLEAALADLERWSDHGIRVHTVLDAEYPANLRAAPDRPPMIFVDGEYEESDARSVAVIGSRSASPAGLARARAVAEQLVDCAYTVVSGLAAGIDTAAHSHALARGGRTLAVVGTGVQRCYPRANAALQRRIAAEGAVISQFLPDAGPTRKNFPKRNAVMSGLTRATVVVEASLTSGARTQVRSAHGQNRLVFLARPVLDQAWAHELAERPGTIVFDSPGEIVTALDRLGPAEDLVA
jgi:DNA processing protein